MNILRRPKTYSLTLSSSIEVSIRAHALAKDDNHYLFLYRFCTAEIPISEVLGIELGSDFHTIEDNIGSSTIGNSFLEDLCCYHSQISETGYCLIKCTDAYTENSDNGVIHFLCGECRFMTLRSTSGKHAWQTENHSKYH